MPFRCLTSTRQILRSISARLVGFDRKQISVDQLIWPSSAFFPFLIRSHQRSLPPRLSLWSITFPRWCASRNCGFCHGETGDHWPFEVYGRRAQARFCLWPRARLTLFQIDVR
ncbi:uncharacterized protein IAS62_006190 [Cryptococcus decagattii]|uniref:Uncharacterized protein n=1 Tax=Cryptococcus decagattii TaxID=1859122 RepID=A0ABZ2B5B6_9TREE